MGKKRSKKSSKIAQKENAILEAFEKGLVENNFDLLFSFLDEDDQINRKLSKDKITLLHKFCQVDVDTLKIRDHEDKYVIEQDVYNEAMEKLINVYKIDINATDLNDNTPLYYAISVGNINAVSILLEQDAISLNCVNKQGLSPIEVASKFSVKEIEMLLLDKMNNVINEVEISAGHSIKEHQTHKKQSIIDIGPLKTLDKKTKPTTIEAIESVTYFENREQAESIHNKFETLSQNSILRPMINMMGLCAIKGTTSENDRLTLFGRKQKSEAFINSDDNSLDDKSVYQIELNTINKKLGKRFKIICIDDINTNSLKITLDEPRGIYTNKNTIFVATKEASIDERIGFILHESCHFIIEKLFENSCNPFPKSKDNDLKSDYYKVFEKTFNQMQNIIDIESKSEIDKIAYTMICNAYLLYPENNRAAELIVRVPQIIATFGEQGYDWLQYNTPELLEFYETKINPNIINYLNENKAVDYLQGYDHEFEMTSVIKFAS